MSLTFSLEKKLSTEDIESFRGKFCELATEKSPRYPESCGVVAERKSLCADKGDDFNNTMLGPSFTFEWQSKILTILEKRAVLIFGGILSKETYVDGNLMVRSEYAIVRFCSS